MNRFSYLVGIIILTMTFHVDAQVRAIQGGRALDSSYLIGSGGYNTIRYTRQPFNANLYVTGQVTGGFYYFHGDLPYSAPNTLGINTASAGMERFERISVGLNQITAGVHYGPAMYLFPSSTVLSARGITSGYNLPGTSMPRASYIPPKVAEKLFNRAVKSYSPINVDMGQRLWVNPLIPPQQTTGLTNPITSANRALIGRGASRPGASSLFGLIGSIEHEKIARELIRTQEEQPEYDVARREDTEIKLKQASEKEGVPLGITQQGQPKPSEREQSIANIPAPGEDVLLDLLIMMEKMMEEDQQQAGQNALEGGKTPAGSKRNADKVGTILQPGQEEQDETDFIRPLKPLNIRRRKSNRVGAVEVDKGRFILHGLAGKSKDAFNINMSRAEKELSAGKYYQAAEYYKLASMASPSSMLAPLGRSLALFAAGEPLSAAFYLRRAMEKFAPLLTGKVIPDVKKILNPHIVKLRLAGLERRIIEAKDKPEVELLFLASFIRCSLGDLSKAAKHADMLLKILGHEEEKSNKQDLYEKQKRKILRIYAHHIIELARKGEKKPTPTTMIKGK